MIRAGAHFKVRNVSSSLTTEFEAAMRYATWSSIFHQHQTFVGVGLQERRSNLHSVDCHSTVVESPVKFNQF